MSALRKSKRSILLVGGGLGLLSVYLGVHHARSEAATVQASGGPRILFYQDPMHPSYRSNKPGKAPDCGMDLVPVYAASGVQNAVSSSSVHLTPQAHKLIGLETTKVTSSAMARPFETTGKVVADESRIYRVSALADGVVRSVSPLAAGSPVAKDQRLATYFVPTRELYNAVQAFILASGSYEASATAAHDTAALKGSKAQARVEEELLQSYGLSSQQIRDLARTHEVTRDIDLRSPATGVILDREISSGQALQKGAEVFRIADLRSVWVLADVYEQEAVPLRTGQAVKVLYAGKEYQARVGPGREFDAASHTTKVRLEVNNPNLVLRPDMFVNVQLNASGKNHLLVPSDAVLDTGTRKVVFVAAADGSFAPREITTGDEREEQVEVRTGLEAGEEVVTHGAFLLDSESRLQLRSASRVAPMASHSGAVSVIDPECGMPVESIDPALSEMQDGKRVYFCSRACKRKYDAKHDGSKTAQPSIKAAL